MSQGKPMALERALKLAQGLVEDLRPGCDRIEIAGSIRRRRPEVNDIEILAIPRARERLVLGQPVNYLAPILAGLEKARLILPHSRMSFNLSGKNYRYELPHARIMLDLFLCAPETWGCLLALRTGPADFSKRLVTHEALGGLCPNNLDFKGGRLKDFHTGTTLETPEETDVFKALEIPFIEPWER